MAYTLFPPKCRLQCRTIVSGYNLAIASDPGRLLRAAIEDSTEMVIRKVFEDCMTQTPHEGTKDITLAIDCYVFSPAELQKLLLDARQEGQREAERWMRMAP